MRRVLDRSLQYITVRELCDNHEENFSYDLETQRNFVWDAKRKNLLIDSILLNSTINTLYVNRRDGVKRVMDGQNRNKTILSFVRNEWAFDKNYTFEIKDKNGKIIESHNLGGLKFNELPNQFQDAILNYSMVFEQYYELSNEEENEICYRLNRGMSPSQIDQTRMLARGDIQNFVIEVANTDFFERKVNITKHSKNLNNHELLIYNILLFELDLANEISVQNTLKFVEYLKKHNLLTEDVKERMLNTVEYLGLAFPKKLKYLKSKNVIAIYFVAKQAIKDNVEARKFCDIMDSFFKDEDRSKEFTRILKQYLTDPKVKQATEILLNHYNKSK